MVPRGFQQSDSMTTDHLEAISGTRQVPGDTRSIGLENWLGDHVSHVEEEQILSLVTRNQLKEQCQLPFVPGVVGTPVAAALGSDMMNRVPEAVIQMVFGVNNRCDSPCSQLSRE